MEEMNEELLNTRLESLEKVNRVEVSPFLKTRIDQAILNQNSVKINFKWALSLIASFAIVLMVNIVTISTSKSELTETELTLNDLGLSDNNNLY